LTPGPYALFWGQEPPISPIHTSTFHRNKKKSLDLNEIII
jgi:hypothetical protein